VQLRNEAWVWRVALTCVRFYIGLQLQVHSYCVNMVGLNPQTEAPVIYLSNHLACIPEPAYSNTS